MFCTWRVKKLRKAVKIGIMAAFILLAILVAPVSAGTCGGAPHYIHSTLCYQGPSPISNNQYIQQHITISAYHPHSNSDTGVSDVATAAGENLNLWSWEYDAA
jgi:hypothetical protein